MIGDIYAAHYWLDRDLHAQIANQYHDVQIPAKFSYRILFGLIKGQGIRLSRALVPTTNPQPLIASSTDSTILALASKSLAPAARHTARGAGYSFG